MYIILEETGAQVRRWAVRFKGSNLSLRSVLSSLVQIGPLRSCQPAALVNAALTF